jgi:hypothetical protein
MEHNEAIQLKAAEKYVLRELPEDLRAAYEEHFFDCAECAADIRAAAMFAETSREIFAEELNPPVPQPLPAHSSAWSRWLRPIVAVPVFAGLLLVLLVGYQSFRMAPTTKSVATVAGQLAATDMVQNPVRLFGEERRGAGDQTVVKVRSGEAFTLDFDFLSSQKFDSYLGELRDDAGHAVLAVTLGGDMANREVHVAVPAGVVHPGKYSLAFSGISAAHPAEKDTRVESFAFTVEFVP